MGRIATSFTQCRQELWSHLSLTQTGDGSLAGPVSLGGDGPACRRIVDRPSGHPSGNGNCSYDFRSASLCQELAIDHIPSDGGVSHPHMALERTAEVFVSDLMSLNPICHAL
jgi:hypothetical protein